MRKPAEILQILEALDLCGPTAMWQEEHTFVFRAVTRNETFRLDKGELLVVRPGYPEHPLTHLTRTKGGWVITKSKLGPPGYLYQIENLYAFLVDEWVSGELVQCFPDDEAQDLWDDAVVFGFYMAMSESRRRQAPER